MITQFYVAPIHTIKLIVQLKFVFPVRVIDRATKRPDTLVLFTRVCMHYQRKELQALLQRRTYHMEASNLVPYLVRG